MNYELAKQLKDNGFPDINICTRTDDHEKAGCKECFFECFPTLSELIEACGDGLRGILKVNDSWIAGQIFEYGVLGGIIGNGKTPEEAVAKLWLKLNKK